MGHEVPMLRRKRSVQSSNAWDSGLVLLGEPVTGVTCIRMDAEPPFRFTRDKMWAAACFARSSKTSN